VFAIQYVDRPGNGYGGYVVNDGTHTVFIAATTSSDIGKLYRWLGKGDMAKGRDEYQSDALTLPSVSLNPMQYNDMVNPMSKGNEVAYIKEG
jgi:hypothetical protein